MTQDPTTGITILDETLAYADHAEDEVLAVLEKADDRSSSSDELAESIADWPSRYHFSHLRGGILSPLDLKPGLRVLEIGCGSGAVTRRLGESGASVIGLEGALQRARAAHIRCRDLDNVEIICGSLQAYEDAEGFDIVVVIGVLEYSGSFIEGDDPYGQFLARVRKLCRPDGVVVLAIENQLGLKYLLGWPEDHLGTAWSSVEGYPDKAAVETFSRRRLGEMLTDHGFSKQRWYYPFPDYKLPTTILSQTLYEMPTGPALVDQLVRRPVADHSHSCLTKAEPRSSHRQFLRAGIGTDVANSFLIIAGAQESALNTVSSKKNLAWILGGERLRAWKRTQTVVQKGKQTRIVSTPVDSRTIQRRQRSWLSQNPERDDEFRLGTTCEQEILEAVRGLQWDALLDALKDWWATIVDAAYTETAERPESQHPFDDPKAEHRLPSNWLDIHPSNFVINGTGIHYIDSEWNAVGGVDLTRAGLRALWYLAVEFVTSGTPLPWPEQASAREIWATLAENLDLPNDPETLEALLNAEAEFQSLVTGDSVDQVLSKLEWSSNLARTSPEVRRSLPYTTLDRRIREVSDELNQSNARHTALEESFGRCTENGHELEFRLDESRKENVSLNRRAQNQEAALSELEKELASFRRFLPASHHPTQDREQTLESDPAAIARAETAERLAREAQARERAATKQKEKTERKASEASRRAQLAERALEEGERALEKAKRRAEEARTTAEEAQQASIAAQQRQEKSRRRAIRRVDEAHREATAAAHQAEEARRQTEGLRRRAEQRMVALRQKAAADLEQQHLSSEEHIDEAGRRIETLRAQLEDLRQENLMWRSWREAFDNRRLIRLYRSIQGLLGRG